MLEFGPKNIWAIEIKCSISNPVPSKGFYIGCADLKATRQIVLYPRKESYRTDPRSVVMSLDHSMKVLPGLARSKGKRIADISVGQNPRAQELNRYRNSWARR